MTRFRPTFVIHRKRIDGWRSALYSGLAASTGAATYADACAQAEATIRAVHGPDYTVDALSP